LLKKKQRQERLDQIGAAIGIRTTKSGKMPWFSGYKKHTAYWMLRVDNGSWAPVPICSLIRPGNVKEQRVTKPLLNWIFRHVRWPVSIILTDQGYVDSRLASFLRTSRNAAMVYKPKTTMTPPAGTEPDGCPICAMGERLVWQEYDAQSAVLVYHGNEQHCRSCPLAGQCPRIFEFDAAMHETFWGMIPSHSKLARMLLQKFRPRAEPGFNTTKNRHNLKDFFLNSLDFTRIACTMSDILICLEIVAKKRSEIPRETQNVLELECEQLIMWR
jgi:hypothetical protein